MRILLIAYERIMYSLAKVFAARKRKEGANGNDKFQTYSSNPTR